VNLLFVTVVDSIRVVTIRKRKSSLKLKSDPDECSMGKIRISRFIANTNEARTQFVESDERNKE
jgi:hypothetical protein